MNISTTSKLLRVRAVGRHNGKTRYIGYFTDGTVAVLREIYAFRYT